MIPENQTDQLDPEAAPADPDKLLPAHGLIAAEGEQFGVQALVCSPKHLGSPAPPHPDVLLVMSSAVPTSASSADGGFQAALFKKVLSRVLGEVS